MRVRVPDSISGVPQVMRGRETGVHSRRATRRQPRQRVRDGIRTGVGDSLGHHGCRPAPGRRVRRSYSFCIVLGLDVGTGGLGEPAGDRSMDVLARLLPGPGRGQADASGRGQAGPGQSAAVVTGGAGLGDADGQAGQRVGGDRDHQVPPTGHRRRLDPAQPTEAGGEPGCDGAWAIRPAGVAAGQPERDRGRVGAEATRCARRGGPPRTSGADRRGEGPVQVAGDHARQRIGGGTVRRSDGPDMRETAAPAALTAARGCPGILDGPGSPRSAR
jgi:hypothetical protein